MRTTLQGAAAPPGRRRSLFPGWLLVWVLAVTETISYAALYYCFAVMVAPMRAELRASRATISGARSLAIAVGGLAAPVVGRHSTSTARAWP